MHQLSKDAKDGRMMRTPPMLDISRDRAHDDTTLVIFEFNEQVEGDIKMHNIKLYSLS